MATHDDTDYVPVPTLLTTRQVAAALAVSEPTVRRLSEAGKLPRVRIGTLTRYRMEDLERLIEGLRPEV